MYGWHARLGIVTPSSIIVTEPEFNLSHRSIHSLNH